MVADIAGARHIHSGKVRDLYELDDGRLLMVASATASRRSTSCCDPTIPDKGEILTRMSLWWFEQLADLVPNHVLSTDVPAEVAGRAVICERLEMFPVECVARGYLAGSGLSTTARPARSAASSCPPGSSTARGCPSRSSRRPPRPTLGEHDENVSYDAVVETVGADAAGRAAHLTLAVYAPRRGDRPESAASSWPTPSSSSGAAATAPIVLADEVLTPDSSRFWPADRWQPGPRAAVVRQAVRPRLAHVRRGRVGPGSGRALRRRCRRALSSRPGPPMSRPTSGSPARRSELLSE